MHSNSIGLHGQRGAPGLAVLYASHTVVLYGSLFEKEQGGQTFAFNKVATPLGTDPTSVGFDGAQAARIAPMAAPAAPCPCAPSVPRCFYCAHGSSWGPLPPQKNQTPGSDY